MMDIYIQCLYFYYTSCTIPNVILFSVQFLEEPTNWTVVPSQLCLHSIEIPQLIKLQYLCYKQEPMPILWYSTYVK